MFYDPCRALTKPYISSSLGLGVRRLFEHEKLARPSDTGHYVVATRLFHRSRAKWDMVPGQRANFRGWIFMVDLLPLGIVNGAKGSVQSVEGSAVRR